jgi:hypothetical protein
MATILYAEGRLVEAESYASEALATYGNHLSTPKSRLASAHECLARIYSDWGDEAAAADHACQASEIRINQEDREVHERIAATEEIRPLESYVE